MLKVISSIFQFSSITSYKLQYNQRGFNYNRASADRNSYTDLFSLVICDLLKVTL